MKRVLAVLLVLVVVLGAVLRTQTIWLMAEIINGLMAIPNLIVLGALSPELINLYKNYLLGGSYENFHQRQSL